MSCKNSILQITWILKFVADDLASILVAEKLAELEFEPDEWDF
jgi:hypothetical protein